jgi:putative membrane protein
LSVTTQTILASWSPSPGIIATLAVVGAIYVRGFRRLHAQMALRFPAWRLSAFLGGLALILIALASPLEAFDDVLLSAHMTQHIILLFAAPPMLLLGAPAIPLVRGLPVSIARHVLGPPLKCQAVRRLGHALTHPIICWLAFTAATWGWHVPAPYEAALRSSGWHAIEHGCFIGAGLMFWFPVVQPWPSTTHWPRWAIFFYLLLADGANTVLSAFFIFSEKLLYPFYASAPRIGNFTPMNDQITAGAIMWVPASLFFLIPSTFILLRFLSPRGMVRPQPAAALHDSPTSRMTIASRQSFSE